MSETFPQDIAAARREPLAQDVIRSFVLVLIAAGASRPSSGAHAARPTRGSSG